MKIRDLADKLQKGNITKEELIRLHSMIDEDDPENVTNEFDEQWDSAKGPSIGINPGKMLKQVRRSIKENERARLITFGLRKKQGFYFTDFLKYAAIFVTGVLMTLAINYLQGISHERLSIDELTMIEVKNGSKSNIQLQDGTTINLNAGSRLFYPQNSKEDFRYVRLVGEAYFDVNENHKKPFYVFTENMTVKALGTQFNVRAYPDENTSETTLITGKVEVYPNETAFKPENKPITLLGPNQKMIIRRKVIHTSKVDLSPGSVIADEKGKTEVLKNVRTEIDTDWRNNVLVFDNEYFSSIIVKLEKWYGVRIVNESSLLDTVRFSGKFDRESISDVLSALSQIEPFSYEINKDIVKLSIKNN